LDDLVGIEYQPLGDAFSVGSLGQVPKGIDSLVDPPGARPS